MIPVKDKGNQLSYTWSIWGTSRVRDRNGMGGGRVPGRMGGVCRDSWRLTLEEIVSEDLSKRPQVTRGPYGRSGGTESTGLESRTEIIRVCKHLSRGLL